MLFSLHLKATMMKVSDPIIFGHAVRAFFADVFAEHGDALARVGAEPEQRPGQRSSPRSTKLPADEREAIEKAIAATYETGPGARDGRLRPRASPTCTCRSDVIIDASMPAMIRTSGQMWNADGEQQDTKAVIPDSSLRGALRGDDRLLPRARRVRPGDDGHDAERRPDGAEGRGVRQPRQDVRDRRRRARARGRRRRATRCSSTTSRRATSGAPARPRTRRSRDWVRLAVERARATGAPAVFWLDETRAHDAEVLAKVARLPRRARHRRAADRDPAGRRGDPLHARARQARRGHDLGHRQRAARLPDRPVPDPRARHEREDALDRAADERRRAVRDRRGRLGAEARAAAREGEPPALGLARRVPRAGGVARVPGRQDRQPARRGARQDARRGHRAAARERQVAVAQGRRARQPRQPLLPRALLGAGAGRAERRRRAGRGVRAARRARWPTTRRRSSASSTAVQGEPVDLGGYYLVDRDEGRRRDAPERDVQRGAGRPEDRRGQRGRDHRVPRATRKPVAGCRSVVRRALAVPAARQGRFPALLHLPAGRARGARHQHRVRVPAGVGAGGGAGAARPGRAGTTSPRRSRTCGSARACSTS